MSVWISDGDGARETIASDLAWECPNCGCGIDANGVCTRCANVRQEKSSDVAEEADESND